jgi:hypothetical protein
VPAPVAPLAASAVPRIPPSAAPAAVPAGPVSGPAQRFPLGSPGRSASPAEAAGIVVAVTTSGLVAGIPDGVVVSRIRVSELRPEWAFVALRPARAGAAGPAVGVLRRTPSGWVLDQVGTYDVGRERVPPAVQAEFGLAVAA